VIVSASWLVVAGLAYAPALPGRAVAAPAGSVPVGSQEHVLPGEAVAAAEIRDVVAGQVEAKFRSAGPPAQRDAHAKAQGCVKAHVTVLDTVPAALRRGLFKKARTYTAWIRFSNAVGTDDHTGLARGMAIKLTGVPGRKVLPAEASETTADLLLVNYPVFNIKTPPEYVDFFKASEAGTLPAFFSKHPREGALFAAIGAQRVVDPLLERYFSMTPYALGSRYAKYSAQPVSCRTGAKLHDDTTGPLPPGPNYLRAAMVKSLGSGASCFSFEVQAQTDPAAQPVEDSTVLWNEAQAPFVPVATIQIPAQRFESAAQQTFCENLSYTPWHALPENRPVGNINRIRRVVYDAISILRHKLNGVARREPTGIERFEGSPVW
jgi:hypothetical protein